MWFLFVYLCKIINNQKPNIMQTYTKNLNVTTKQKRRFSDDEDKMPKFKNSSKRIQVKSNRSGETFYEN